jgi:hypothetical protein
MAALAPPFDAEDHFELQRMVKAGLSKRIPQGFRCTPAPNLQNPNP